MSDETLARELAHHEALYSGFAQQHFAKPAVRALRAHMVRRILAATGAGVKSRVLSLGCGIGDTEILLAPHVGSITGVDLSPAAIKQAREDGLRAGVANAEFVEAGAAEAGLAEGSFDAVIGIFFLHHLPDPDLKTIIRRIGGWLKPGGIFYGLDPSRYRLSGALGSLLIPHLMRRYQTPDEHEMKPSEAVARFVEAGFRRSLFVLRLLLHAFSRLVPLLALRLPVHPMAGRTADPRTDPARGVEQLRTDRTQAA